MAKILLVEDDEDLCVTICDRLKAEQHMVEVVHSGREGADRLRLYSYDFVILDWNLPGMTGPEVCRDHRNHGGSTPILMLTGRAEVQDKESGLDAGADDYLTKPFSTRELAARIRAILRRPQVVQDETLEEGNVVINTVKHTVTVAGKSVHLHPKEFAILELLLKHKSQVFSTDVLLDRLWNSESDATVDSVRTTIKRLRQKIDTDGESLIKTVHGVGYKIGPS